MPTATPPTNDIAIQCGYTPFAVCSLSSLTDDDIPGSDRLLLTAAARAQNTGMAFNMARTEIADRGKAPVIAEPVVGTITFRTERDGLVLRPINVDGTRAPAARISVNDGTANVTINDTYQTIFYEITTPERSASN